MISKLHFIILFSFQNSIQFLHLHYHPLFHTLQLLLQAFPLLRYTFPLLISFHLSFLPFFLLIMIFLIFMKGIIFLHRNFAIKAMRMIIITIITINFFKFHYFLAELALI